MHVGIEAHLTEDQFAAVDAGLPRPVGVGIEKRTAKAVAAGMGKNQQAAHGTVKTPAVPLTACSRRVPGTV
jgi:hypothetical protein